MCPGGSLAYCVLELLQAAEAGKRKAEEELRRVRAEALASAEHATAQLAASKALASAAETGLAAKTTQVQPTVSPLCSCSHLWVSCYSTLNALV